MCGCALRLDGRQDATIDGEGALFGIYILGTSSRRCREEPQWDDDMSPH